MEHLGIRDHQQVKCGLLTIAQEQILAYHSLQDLINFLAVLHGHGRSMIHAVIFHPEPVQQVIGTDLFVQSAGRICRSSFL